MRRIALLLGVAVIALSSACGGDSPPSLESLQSGVGLVETLNCDGTPLRIDGHAVSGSGFLIGSRVVMTAEHGMYIGLDQPACKLRVRFGERIHPVTSVRAWSNDGEDDRRGIDLATLTLAQPADGHLFEIAPEGAAVGASVRALGYPLGGPFKASRGRVTSIVRDYGVPSVAAKIDIEGGNSGGPMVDERGDVVSVVSRIVVSGSLTADGSNRSGGVDLARWWGANALPDLCRAHPAGGLPDCGAGEEAEAGKVPVPIDLG